MARDFNGTTSKIQGSAAAVDSGSWTLGCWVNLDTSGEGGSNGRIIQIDASGIANQLLRILGGSLQPSCSQQAGTTIATATATPSLIAGVWYALFGTFDASSGRCKIWWGTLAAAVASQTLGTDNAMAGARATGSTLYCIGNNPGQTTTTDGRITAPFFVPWLMTVDEMERFRQGDRTVLFDHGLPRFFLPLDSPTAAQAEDLSGNGNHGTATSAAVADDPPVPMGWGGNAVPVLVVATAGSVSATFDAPLGALVASVSATVEHPATLAAPLGGLSASISATVEHAAVLAAPLGAATAAIAATVEHPATLAAPLGSATASITETVEHPAAFSAPLGSATAALAGTVEHPSMFDAPLGPAAASISTVVEHGGTLASPLGSATAAVSASVDQGPVLDAPLGGLSATVAFVISHQAILDSQLGGLTASIAATDEHPAFFAALLGGLSATVTATIEHVDFPDLNPMRVTYTEPSFRVAHQDDNAVAYTDPPISVLQER